MSLIIRSAELGDLNGLTDIMSEYIVGFYKNPRPATEKLHQLIHTLLEKKEGAQRFFDKMGGVRGDWVNYSIT